MCSAYNCLPYENLTFNATIVIYDITVTKCLYYLHMVPACVSRTLLRLILALMLTFNLTKCHILFIKHLKIDVIFIFTFHIYKRIELVLVEGKLYYFE